ncbi:MAG: XRE family transcriptional regulator [Thermodesulfobacteriota bacterium]
MTERTRSGKKLEHSSDAGAWPNVGSRIRDLRKKEGLSLPKLAKLTGIAASNLSSLELNKSSPTLNTLIRIAAAFNMKLGAFLDEVVYEKAVVRRKGQGEKPKTKIPGHTVEMLAGDHAHHTLQAWLVAIKARSKPFAIVSRDTDLFVYCLEGEISVRVENTNHSLKAGDTLYLLASTTARFTNSGAGTARMLFVRVAGAIAL